MLYYSLFFSCIYLNNVGLYRDYLSHSFYNCLLILLWQVEIGIRQYFMGSLNGRAHTNVWHEMCKLKGWLSSHVLQEQFPSHYADIINSLPLQEYMNPLSGLLNLAANWPPEIQKPDLGPCLYISYGCAEELVQAESVTKLCYDSYDVVCLRCYSHSLFQANLLLEYLNFGLMLDVSIVVFKK